MKLIKLNENTDKYDLVHVICDFCCEKIESDIISINHIFTPKSKFTSGQKIEVDLCDECFVNNIYNQLNYRTFD